MKNNSSKAIILFICFIIQTISFANRENTLFLEFVKELGFGYNLYKNKKNLMLELTTDYLFLAEKFENENDSLDITQKSHLYDLYPKVSFGYSFFNNDTYNLTAYLKTFLSLYGRTYKNKGENGSEIDVTSRYFSVENIGTSLNLTLRKRIWKKGLVGISWDIIYYKYYFNSDYNKHTIHLNALPYLFIGIML